MLVRKSDFWFTLTEKGAVNLAPFSLLTSFTKLWAFVLLGKEINHVHANTSFPISSTLILTVSPHVLSVYIVRAWKRSYFFSCYLAVILHSHLNSTVTVYQMLIFLSHRLPLNSSQKPDLPIINLFLVFVHRGTIHIKLFSNNETHIEWYRNSWSYA